MVHCRDTIDFYEKGIVVYNRFFPLEELGEISFMDVRSNYTLFTRTYMRTAVRNFNLTYIKDGKRNFNRAYFDTIE